MRSRHTEQNRFRDGMKINFVLLGAASAEIAELAGLDPEHDWTVYNSGERNWILQAYLRLKRRGYDCELSNAFAPGGINVAANSKLRRAPRDRSHFVVGVRADYPAVRWVSAEIVQNKRQVDERSFWLPHYPQPSLIPRNPSRGTAVESAGHFGNPINFYSRFFRRARGFATVENAATDICASLGIELRSKPLKTWNDYSDTDVSLGLREFGRYEYVTKPATKLVNAWLARTPFIGGADCAYCQIGTPGYDYLKVTNPSQLRDALSALKTNPNLFRELVDRGARGCADYVSDRITDRWIELMESALHERFMEYAKNRRH